MKLASFSHPPLFAAHPLPLLPVSTKAALPRRHLWKFSGPSRWRILSAASDTGTDADLAASTAFSSLLEECNAGDVDTATLSAVKLQAGVNGRGIFAAKEIPQPANVIFRVPLDTCLVVDYSEGGLKVPSGNWPRIQKGLAKDNALPWDIIHSLALLDGLAGDGNEFWARYCTEILPLPESMTEPVCLPEDLLMELEHDAIIEGALLQKERLAGLFPGLSTPACEGGPTWFQWAFACVRSRAFRLGQDTFAFVPFLDTVNHAQEPNANFEMSPDRKHVNLVSLKNIDEEAEVTISYTGEIGYTNQRMMAQYGFVPQTGNPFDRIEFKTLQKKENNEKTENSQNSSGSGRGAVLVSLDALQAVLGDGDAMVDAFSGRDTFTYAALKSLPLAAMESDAAPMVDQLALAEELLVEVEEEIGRWRTSVEEDASTLLHITSADTSKETVDPRMGAVVRYRLHRKRMLEAGARLLKAFLHR